MPAKPQRKGGWDSQSWLRLRTTVQILAFLGFLVLFLYASQVLMGFDPLAMLANLISSRHLAVCAWDAIY